MRPGHPLVRRPALAAQSDGLITHYHDDLTCTERVAIVTGGSRGVGREVVRKLANRGYAVVVGYIRDQGAADSIVEEVLAAGGTALTIRADVADELDVERMFVETTEAFGGIDIVVHAAGQVILGPVADHDLDRFDALQRTNVRGTFVVNRQAARQLREGGTIVNLAGSAVGSTLPIVDAASAASSAAVEAMTRVLAGEVRGRHIGQRCRTRAGEPGRSRGHRRHRGIPRQRRRPQPQWPGHPCRRRDRVKTRPPGVRSRAHAPRASATEQWESPPPEERTARTPRYHGVQEADQGMRRLANTVNPKAVESASSWRGQPRDALAAASRADGAPRTKASSRFYPGRPDHAALLGAARQVVEERRLTDAGFTPHGKRAGAGAPPNRATRGPLRRPSCAHEPRATAGEQRESIPPDDRTPRALPRPGDPGTRPGTRPGSRPGPSTGDDVQTRRSGSGPSPSQGDPHVCHDRKVDRRQRDPAVHDRGSRGGPRGPARSHRGHALARQRDRRGFLAGCNSPSF